ncbi:hypothetical protein HMPREF0765_0438 [Sphingobacterium spiritivorum ATCC 33300]|uniref:F0F1-ATPase subunit n=1 Tax=Sphingobacterium spiritivorum ATCC 33300 TaxID=525372 RepID=C2FSY2_SPHSI|nr:AtpZ/AtpI family protein [Sphingobacterium spiritivorum]EEI94106.1 hypothetical protein HMPREF0765_0438 [Sphingobacterium spiritivorum ATCC 33300]QQS94383.1 AtpZ/AtpI family protein [Sphingobacterium spiritivorum]
MEKKSGPNKWMMFIAMPSQMGITVYLFYMLGTWLDKKYGWENEVAMKVSTFIGVIVSMYYFIKQANRLSKND